jgi:hypothetical protein
LNLEELIASTNKIKNRDQGSVFKKKFGSIYAFNKNITIFKGGNAIIINMIIGGVTDYIKMGGKRQPVPYHKVSLALNVGKDGKKDYSAEGLVEAIRARHSEYRDEQKWPNPDVLKAALENPSKFFDDATIFKTTNGEGYTVITNNIPENSEVQVWCSCSDYYWTMQYYNQQTRNKDGSCLNLYGSMGYPKVYNHRSAAGKKSKRPMRNPGRHPGMCKHLMLLVAMLMKEEIISDTKNGLVKYYKANYDEFLKNNEKSRISQASFEKKMQQYERGHRIMNDQRNTAHFMAGNKTEKQFRPENQDLKIVNINEENGTKFNPLTQERTRKSSGNFNPNTGRFKWENKGR